MPAAAMPAAIIIIKTSDPSMVHSYPARMLRTRGTHCLLPHIAVREHGFDQAAVQAGLMGRKASAAGMTPMGAR